MSPPSSQHGEEGEEGHESKVFRYKDHVWALVYCAFFSIGAFLFGYDMAYFGGVEAMTPFINLYGDKTDANGNKFFSASLLSLLTSLIQIGDLIGSLASGAVGFYFGRKGGLLAASVCCVVGIVLQAAASGSSGTFITGRIILGCAVGILSNAVPLYLSDVTPKQIRGLVVGSWQLVLAFAGLVGAAINQGTESIKSQASFQIPICFQLICPLIFFTFVWFVPESPRFLIARDRVEDARTALIKINRSNKNYDPELELTEFLLQEQAERASPKGSWMELITNPVERRKTVCCAGTFAAQQLTGASFIATYCTVFAIDLEIANPFAITMILQCLCMLGVLFNWLFVERVNRKTILLYTTGMMIIIMLVVGGLACGPEKAHLVPTSPLGQTIIGLALIYMFVFNAGWGPLAWAVATEQCVGHNRPRIMAVSTAVFWIFSWLVTFTLPYLFTTANLGAKIGFIYAGGCVCSWLFVFFVLPETKGRSLEELEEMYEDGISSRKWADHKTRIETEALNITKGKHIVDIAERPVEIKV